MEQKFCQSCGMPLIDDLILGTNEDLSSNEDYCIYCFDKGHFTQDLTMDQMIEHCAQFVDEFNNNAEQKLTKEQVIAHMKSYFPHLKRWKS